MERRSFLDRLGAALGLSLAGFWGTRSTAFSLGRAEENDAVLEKVKTAMLTMQRQAWEQGVAAQALLELGDKELVVMMAKEAVLRQWDDGRLGQVCDNHGVTDPGANGEAVLFAGRILKDEKLLQAARRRHIVPE